MQNYSGAVPAVQKTIAVLEHLRVGVSAPTLTELSQALSLNRSSLLAILNTLRTAGFVSRDGADRYHLGPGLLSFAPTAAREAGPVEAFARPAEWLVDSLGESVCLIRLTPQGGVCVAFKMGRHGVRAVIELGQTTALNQSAGALAILAGAEHEDVNHAAAGLGLDAPRLRAELDTVRKCHCAYIEDGVEPGQAALAAPVCDSQGRVVAAIEAVGPTFRMSGTGLRDAGRLVIAAARQASLALGCWTYAPYGRGAGAELWRGHAAGLHGSDFDEFLAQPWVASLACLRENGFPYTVPVWYEWRDGCFWLVPRVGARWAGYLRAHPQVSMTISEPSPPFRRVLVDGHASEVAHPNHTREARDMERRLASRYLGAEASSYLTSSAPHPRTIIRVEPAKMTSWEGLIAHPRYASAGRERLRLTS